MSNGKIQGSYSSEVEAGGQEVEYEIEFQLGHGDLIRVLRSNGFEIEELFELYAPEDAVDHEYYASNAAWAKRWPAEEIWRARLQPR